MAWSALPLIITLIFIPLILLLYGKDYFRSPMTRVEHNPIPYLIFTVFNVVLVAWWYFLFWKCYAEVQQLSLLKALIAIVAPLLILLIIGAVLFGCGMLLMG